MKWGLTCRQCNKTSEPTLTVDLLDGLKELFRKLRPFMVLLAKNDATDLVQHELRTQLAFLNKHRGHLDDVEPVQESSREVRARG
jgi:hypothetical protein